MIRFLGLRLEQGLWNREAVNHCHEANNELVCECLLFHFSHRIEEVTSTVVLHLALSKRLADFGRHALHRRPIFTRFLLSTRAFSIDNTA